MKTESELIIEAYECQDACNLSGIVFAFARAMDRLCEIANEHKKGTEWKNTHPMCLLYSSKIAHLTRTQDHQDQHALNSAFDLAARLKFDLKVNKQYQDMCNE